MTSFVFVVVVRAYDVGDKVVVQGIRNEAVMQVESVDILTTEFFIPQSGRRVSVPNHVLADSSIENLKRSPRVTLTSPVRVAHSTTASQIDKVRSDVEAFIASPAQAGEWKPGAKLTVESVEGAGEGSSQLMLRLQARPRRAWQEMPKVRRLRSMLLLQFVAAMRRHGVKFLGEDAARLQ